jgi:hypothetical protein
MVSGTDFRECLEDKGRETGGRGEREPIKMMGRRGGTLARPAFTEAATRRQAKRFSTQTRR